MQTLQFSALGSTIGAWSTSEAARLDILPAHFAAWERALSRFDPASELSALNTAAGAEQSLSPLLWAALDHALAIARWTDGRITPTILGALEAAGYARSWTQGPTETTSPPPSADWRAIRRDLDRQSVRLPQAMRLDLGGTAKGWLVDRALDLVAATGPVLIDAGGDIAVSGPQPDGSGWVIGIAAPYDEERDCAWISLGQGGVATSATWKRSWRNQERTLHHLIDPISGLPAQTDVVSATVITGNAATADAAASQVVLLGSELGRAWIEAQPGLAALIALEDGSLITTTHWSAFAIPHPEARYG